MKHKFLNRKANYICYMLIISIMIGFFSNNNLMTIYGDVTEISGENVTNTELSGETTGKVTTSETTTKNKETTTKNKETTSSNKTTSDKTTSDKTTSDKTTSDKTTSDKTTSDKTTSDKTTSGEITSGETTSSEKTTGNTTGDSTTGDSTTGDGTTVNGTTSDGTTTGNQDSSDSSQETTSQEDETTKGDETPETPDEPDKEKTDRLATVVGVTNYLSVRIDAGTSYELIFKLYNGDQIYVIGSKYAVDGSLWYNIKQVDEDGTVRIGYVHSKYVEIIYVVDEKFEQYLDEQGFPESYKDSLRKLHEKYPHWVFVADHMDYTWEKMYLAQTVIGRSLIADSSISSYKSTNGAAYNWLTGVWTGYDGAKWVAASDQLIAYCLDPRNNLDEQYIFQFESLSYDSSLQNEAGVINLIKNSFMNGAYIESGKLYSVAIMEAAAQSGVNPYHLTASIIQELGLTTPSAIISGTVKGYEGYYNYYNWGAYVANGYSAIQNGLKYAMKTDPATLRPWNTRYKALIGGAIKLGTDYINKGQNTTYYKKFNPILPGTHQYMTHILAAQVEGARVSKGYSQEMKDKVNFTFTIPVYKDMPETPATIPTTDGSPNNALKSLEIEGLTLTPSFEPSKPIECHEFTVTVPFATTKVVVNASVIDSTATITGTGEHKLSVGANAIIVAVTAQNGDVRNYTLNVIREEGVEEQIEPVYSVSLPKDEANNLIKGLTPEMSVEAVIANFSVTNATLHIADKNGNEKTTGIVGTGDKVFIKDIEGNVIYESTFILYGDVDGDGKINIKDSLFIRKHNLNTTQLEGVYLLAGDVSRNGDGITVADALILRKYNLGQRTINQN